MKDRAPIPVAILEEEAQRFMAKGFGWASAVVFGLGVFQVSPVVLHFGDHVYGIPAFSFIAGGLL